MYACDYHYDFHTTECGLVPYIVDTPTPSNNNKISPSNNIPNSHRDLPSSNPKNSSNPADRNLKRPEIPDLGVAPKSFNFGFSNSFPSNHRNPEKPDAKTSSELKKPDSFESSSSNQKSNNLHLEKNPSSIEPRSQKPSSEVNQVVRSQNLRDERQREIEELEKKLKELKFQQENSDFANFEERIPSGFNGNVRVNLPGNNPRNEEVLVPDDQEYEEFKHKGIIKFCDDCHRDALYYCELHQSACCEVHSNCHIGHLENVVQLPVTNYGRNNKIERETKRIVHQIKDVFKPFKGLF
jgi:hypothetical protein